MDSNENEPIFDYKNPFYKTFCLTYVKGENEETIESISYCGFYLDDISFVRESGVKKYPTLITLNNNLSFIIMEEIEDFLEMLTEYNNL